MKNGTKVPFFCLVADFLGTGGNSYGSSPVSHAPDRGRGSNARDIDIVPHHHRHAS
jgi:hypothetical protein